MIYLLFSMLFFQFTADEPMDVPAFQSGQYQVCRGLGSEHCTGPQMPEWSCRDKSRVLLTAEDGSKHCISFKGK